MTPGYTVYSGAWCSTLNYGTGTVPANHWATIAWTTYDSSCIVCDLRWVSRAMQSIMPEGTGGCPAA